uniref:Progestin and adipoQ receptor family member 6 n=1 Tax=Sphenodon punctatus TaxID=8508 RepID=A0A8D0L2L4_SPHPU
LCSIFWEDGIMSGYRHPKSSALDCILSSFQMTNETVNIWTHFLPTWYFVWRFLVLSYSLDFCRDAYYWPFLAYMFLVCLYPFTSSCAHTFSTMSAHARHICYFLDYGALSLYSLGCAFSYGAYSMPDRWVNSTLHHYFVPMAAFNSFICTSLSCYSRFPELECPRLSKILRTLAFVYPFVFDNIPLFYRLLFCFGDDCTWNDTIAGYFYHLLFALLTGFLFASHLPERLAPGRFDYIGESGRPGFSAWPWGTGAPCEGPILAVLRLETEPWIIFLFSLMTSLSHPLHWSSYTLNHKNFCFICIARESG